LALRWNPPPDVVNRELQAEVDRCWDGVPLPRTLDALRDEARRNLLLEVLERRGAFSDGPEGTGRHLVAKSLALIDGPIRNGSSVVVLTPDFGPWQWIGPDLARRGYRVGVVDLRPNLRRPEGTLPVGPGLDLQWLPAQGYARPILRFLDGGPSVLVVLADQPGGPRRGRGTLLGRAAQVASLPFELARKRGLPLVPVFAVRHGSAWELLVEEPIKVSSTGRGAMDLDTAVARWLKLVERYARRHPEHALPMLLVRRMSRYDDPAPLFPPPVAAAK
jgi:hypothetical protein